MRRIRKVNIMISESFYRDLDTERRRVKTDLGLNKISFPDFTEMLYRSGNRIKLRSRKRRINL